MLAGQAVFAACNWALVVVLAQVGGPEIVGRYALAIAVTMPIMAFSQLQIRQVLVSDSARRYSVGDCLIVRIVTSSVAVMIFIAIALLGRYESEIAAVIVVVGLAKGVESISDIFYGLAQRRHRLDLVSMSTMLRAVLGFAVFFAAIATTGSLVWGLVGLTCAWMVVLFVFDRSFLDEAQEEQSSAPALRRSYQCFKLALLGLPLGIALTLATLNLNVPRYFLEWFFGTEALGIFGAVAYFVVAGRMVVNAVGQAALPQLVDYHSQRNAAAFARLLAGLCLVGFLLGGCGLLVAVAFGSEVLDLFYGPEFSAESDLFVWIMTVGLASYTVMPIGGALTAMQSFGVQPVILGVAVAVNVLGCAFLVPAYGLQGAALGWLTGVLCQGLLGLGVVWCQMTRAMRRPPLAPSLESPAAHDRRAAADG